MAIDYVSTDTAAFFAAKSDKTPQMELLWGDRVQVLDTAGARARVRARGREGYVKKSDLGGTSLLELYVIDVGQGDGLLIRTPDDRHILLDGGYMRAMQDTNKNAADFVDWKFVKDYGRTRIELDAVIASHNDADHYGGLWDLLNAAEEAELDATGVSVEAFYHAGVSWWQSSSGRTLGETTKIGGETFLRQLLGDRASAVAALGGSGPQLQGQWRDFIECVTKTKRKNGTPTSIRRLSHATAYLPGFEPSPGQVAIRVLAPVEFGTTATPLLRRFTSQDSINTNGNSVLLRLDYGRARLLLTGDLNSASQQALLQDYVGERQELQCDVAKACHHGSADVSYEFLQALHPAVTVISSGDNEGHDHPRPNIVAASATTGFLKIENDRLLSPLVYSTELARSVRLGRTQKLLLSGTAVADSDFKQAIVECKVTKPGDLKPKTEQLRLAQRRMVAGLIYGLVNIRTDGNRILCATLDESDATWRCETVTSRF
ncbi:MAG: MBL fold metallo-hydrolase [Deltaproteobacteria bacterium]|nr:MBL fold metallo-hydrolase [Deltaproteobacteria bacterium]